MPGQSSVIQILTNQAGRIRLAGGNEIEVTFSFYQYQEIGFGASGRKSASGCCRVSDGSDVLTRVFEAGLPVRLVGANVEAEIRLTAPYSFQVAGPVLKRSTAAGQHDAASPADAEGM